MATPTPLTKDLNDALHVNQDSKATRSIRYLDTATAYDLWSEIYDTDGNFLQALDSIEMETLLPEAMAMLTDDTNSSNNTGIKAVDLGCGTGRNTLRLLDFPQISEVIAVDLSEKMLEVARRRCIEKVETSRSTSPSPSPIQTTLSFDTYDMLSSPTPPPILTALPANLVISTLVLEHIPLRPFFTTVSQTLAPNGLLLLTNMHEEMGSISQAGFVDPKTGDKIRPTSYAHSVADVVEEARKVGLECVGAGGVRQVRMESGMREALGLRSEKWVGVLVWFGGIWRKKV